MRFAAALALALLLAATPASAEEVTVFAAARLQTALDTIAAQWEARSNDEVALSYAGSSRLARQILEGAPADVFISSSQDWMDELQVEGAIDKDSRRDLLGNSLVLLAHGQVEPVSLSAELDLAGLLNGGRLALALIEAAPIGVHGKHVLTNLGLWERVKGMVTQAASADAVVELVARGQAALGIVHATDAAAAKAAGDDVSVVGIFSDDSHPPAIYPAALIAGREDRGAAFLDFLSSENARAVFEAQGLTLLAGRER